MTPLDVVRVRQQAQSSVSSSTSASIANTFARLPPNLGVSACCRDVFFVSNQSHVCLASGSSGSQSMASALLDRGALAECAAEQSERRSFNGTFDGMRKIARNEGPLTLWRGLSPTLVMAVPANVIYFAGYDWMRAHPDSFIRKRCSDTYAPLAAGALARVMSATAVGPIEMLRTRMQATQSAKPGPIMRETIKGIRAMVRDNGYTSLWRGLTLTLWRDVPFSAFYWWGYEYGRETLHRLREPATVRSELHNSAIMRRRAFDDQAHSQTVFIDSFIAGATSGAIAALATTPFDVGKTRQQTARHHNSAASVKAAYIRPEDRTMPRFLWHIYKKEGMSGLFKGWAARCMKVAPACAIMISSYELGKKLAGAPSQSEA